MVLSPTSDSASGGVTRRRGRARRDRSAASARGEKGDLRELEQVQFGIWCCSPWYPELEVVHDQLQGVEQRFPESPWVFRHRVCGQNPGPKRRMSVYSREERMKAVKLYFQYDRQVAPVLRELG